MKKIKRYLYEDTGMFIDWSQLKKLPEIDTLIDIGVGPDGTPDFYERFPDSKLILIDPLDEAKNFAENKLKHRDYSFYKVGVGKEETEEIIKIEEEIGRSTILDVTEINFEGKPVSTEKIRIKTLDNIIKDEINLGKIGIKIDTEGYELNAILGATNILKSTEFVVAEVRHNYESFQGQYKLHEFVLAMHKNDFILTNIITAKPLIADLCFSPISSLI